MSTKPYIVCFWKDDPAGRVHRLIRTRDGLMIARSASRDTIEAIAAKLNEEAAHTGGLSPFEAATDATRLQSERFNYEHYGRVIAERARMVNGEGAI